MSKVKLSDIAQAINQKGKPLIGEMEETQQLLDGRIQALREQRNKLVAIQAEAKRALREAQEAERAAQAAAEAAGEIPAEAAAPAVDAPAADAPVAPAAEQKPKVEAAPVVPSEFIRSAMQQPPRTPRQRPSGQDGRPPMRAPQGGQGGPAGQGGPGGQRPPRAGQGGPPRGEGQRYPRQGGAPGSGAAGGARGPQPGRPPARPGNAAPAAGARKPRAAGGAPMGLPPVGEKERVSNYDPNRAAYNKNASNDRKPKNKKQLMKENMAAHRGEENTFGSRKRRNKRYEPKVYIEPIKIDHAVIATETVTIKELSEKIGKPSGEIIKKLILLGIIATINQEIDFDTAQLVASEFGVTLEQKLEKTFEEVMQEEVGLRELEVNDTGAIMRAPVVTVMGHVDHGKTSLLDALRRTRVAASEAGGITQHIGASAVELNGRTITFLDTPGHEAFTAMRARGANCTDIAVLVVAADDGIMPQTVEAIHHAQAAEVPIIVAINKIDKEGANVERVKQELTEHNVLAEEWGGETIMVPVSAVTEEGLDTLLEMILLQADVMELKANPDRPARGIIVEAQLDRGRGPVATVLVQNGTLRPGDTIVAGTAYGRVRAMLDDKGNKVEAAGPSQPVVVLGFSEVPHAGDTLNVVEEDKLSRQVAEERRDRIKAQQMKTMSKVTLEDLFSQIADGQVKELNLVIKADVQGSVEAVGQALTRLSNDEVCVKVIHDGVGAINESDIILASASNAIVIGFNVRPDVGARAAADQEKVDVRLYRVIYNAIEDVKNAMLGMLDPEFKEVVYGHAEVRNLFKVSNVGTIAGCYVTDGKIGRNCEVRVLRDNVVVHEGKIDSLKRFKDDVREVATGYECGITLANFNDIKEGDVFEAFVEEEIKRTEV